MLRRQLWDALNEESRSRFDKVRIAVLKSVHEFTCTGCGEYKPKDPRVAEGLQCIACAHPKGKRA